MAQSLEKAFLQKVAQMPQEEEEIPAPVPRGKQGKPKKGHKSSKNGGETINLNKLMKRSDIKYKKYTQVHLNKLECPGKVHLFQ